MSIVRFLLNFLQFFVAMLEGHSAELLTLVIHFCLFSMRFCLLLRMRFCNVTTEVIEDKKNLYLFHMKYIASVYFYFFLYTFVQLLYIFSFSGSFFYPCSSAIKKFVQKDQQNSCRATVVGAYMAHWLVGWCQGDGFFLRTAYTFAYLYASFSHIFTLHPRCLYSPH